MKSRVSRLVLTVLLAVSMTVTMMPSFAFAAVTDETGAGAQQMQPAEASEENPSDESAEAESTEKAEAVTDGEASTEAESAEAQQETDGASEEEPSEEASEDGKTAEETSEAEPSVEKEEEKASESSAGYVEKDGLIAVDVQGKAAESKASAQAALKEETDLSRKEIRDISEELFAEPSTRAQTAKGDDDEEIPRQGDGSNIENISAKWITPDTVDNDDDSFLYVKPEGDEDREVRLQVKYALSGEHGYDPGDVTITVPAYIFKNRAGKDYGNMIIPYPEDPSTKDDFNWKLVGDNYVLTNTKQMSAATTGFIQFKYNSLTPHELVDMEVSEPFSAYIEVLTHKNNIIALRSNELTAQFDTEAIVTNVFKNSYGAPERVAASEIPEAQRIEGEEEYIRVKWYVGGATKANTMYTLDAVDTIPENAVVVTKDDGTEITEKDAQAFIIKATSEDGRTLEDPAIYTGHRTDNTAYYYYATAYPASQFEKDTEYTFHNNIEYIVTEVDPAAEVVNPNVCEEDPQKVTTVKASAKTTWSYTDPKWYDPEGHYMVYKNGNDDTPKDNVTHQLHNGTRSDRHLRSNGWYGIYPSAVNDLRDGENVRLSYTIESIGYLMPWTYKEIYTGTPMKDKDGNLVYDDKGNVLWEIPAGRIIGNYFQRPVKMTTEDTGISIGRYGAKLVPLQDYKFVEIEFPEAPWIYTGVPKNINDDGSWMATSPTDGTFEYSRDNNISHCPDIDLEIQRNNGEWQKWATARWSGGTFNVILADGTRQTDKVISVPSDTTNFRTVVTSTNAAIDYDVRAVIELYATDDIKAQVNAAFEKTNEPSMVVYNETNMTAERADADERIVSIDKDGYDKLRGYTPDIAVYPSKTSSCKDSDIDYANNVATIHYSAKVEERSIISERETYLQAIEDKTLKPETHGIWRDLLPKGVTPLKNTIKLRSGDSNIHVSTIENYKGSGRTMLIVEADLEPTPVRYKSGDMYYYEDVPTISFDAQYNLDYIKDYGKTIHNVISFESSNDVIGTIEGYKGEPDDPYSDNNAATKNAFRDDEEKDLMKDLNKKRETPSFVYAGASTFVDALAKARTSLDKAVMVNYDGWWSDGLYYGQPDQNKRTVYIGGYYSYRLRMMSDTDTISKDLIIYDSLEDFYAGNGNDRIDIDAPRWQGEFLGVDVSQLEAQDCAPVVYYCTRNIQLADEEDPDQGNPTNMDLTDTSIWTKASEYDGDLSAVKAIAVDASKDVNGNDFRLEPQESATVIINMLAPSGEEASEYIAQKGDWGDSAHAYNNAFLTCTSIDANNGQSADNFVRKDYTKVGLEEYKYTVSKEWADDDDRDGKRPDTTVYHLYRDGEDTGKTLTLPIIDEETGEEVWTGCFENLPYCDPAGNKYQYTAKEEEVEDYTAKSSQIQDNEIYFRNIHEPERIDISGVKKWVGDHPENRPEYVTVKLYADGKLYAQKTVHNSGTDEWTYEFKDLYKYNKGKEIEYKIEEASNTTEVRSYLTEVNEYEIINTYHPYGDLYVSKETENTTAASAEQDFTFTFEFTRSEGGSISPVFEEYDYDILSDEDEVIGSGKIATNGTIAIKGGQKIHVKNIDEYVRYNVTEDVPDGFKQKSVTDNKGQIKPNETAEADFVNRYSAEGRIDLEAEKTLLNRELTKYQFHYLLYRVNEDGTEEIESTGSNDRPETIEKREDGTVASSTGTVTFSTLKFTEKDARIQAESGKPYVYRIVEKAGTLDCYDYDETEYTAEVTVADTKSNGKLDVTVRYFKEGSEVETAVFTNKYSAYGELDKLYAWKSLKGRKIEEGEFTFALLDEKGDPVLDKDGNAITATNDASGFVKFPALEYTEADIGKTYHYAIREVAGTDGTVNYTGDVFGYTVVVVDNEDGKLTFTQTASDPVLKVCEVCGGGENAPADCTGCAGTGYSGIEGWSEGKGKTAEFINTLKDGKLSVTKRVKDSENADPAQKFRFKVKLTGDKVTDDLVRNYTITKVAEEDTAGKNTTDNTTNTDAANSNSSGDASGKPYNAEAEEGTKTSSLWDGVTSLASDVFESFSEPLVLTAYGADDDIASGTWGTCTWVIDADGVLTIRPTNGASGTIPGTYNRSNIPWYNNYRTQINKVVVKETVVPQNCWGLFTGLSNCTEIDLSGLDTSNVTNMVNLFENCKSLTTLDVSPLVTSKVIYMGSMFEGCSSLKELDLSTFDTSGVTGNFNYMFQGCTSLTSVNVSSFDVSNAASFLDMFSGCSSLKRLDISNFEPAKATSMNGMLGAGGLQEIVLGEKFSFKGNGSTRTTLPENGSGLWIREDGAYGPFTPAELADSYTPQMAGTWILEPKSYAVVTDDNELYFIRSRDPRRYGGQGTIQSVSGNEYTGNIYTNFESIIGDGVNSMPWYSRRKNITSVVVVDEGIQPKSLNYWFYEFENAETIDVQKLDVSQAVGFTRAFAECKKVRELDFTGWDTSNVTDLSRMFFNCQNLETLDVSGFETSGLTKLSGIFYNCQKLKDINVSNFDVSEVKDFSSIFSGCKALETLDLSGWDTLEATSEESMFRSCDSLKEVKLGTDFSFTANATAARRGILPTPPENMDGIEYTGKWIREDKGAGPFTPQELRDNYTPEMAGTWVWEKESTAYTIEFKAEEGVAGSMSPAEAEAAEDYTLPACAFVKAGNEFDHWVDDKGNTYPDASVIPANTFGIGDKLVLTAVFKERDTSVEMKDGEFEFYLYAGETATFDNIPAGTTYSVYEDTPEGWILIDDETINTVGTIKPLETSEALFTNQYAPDITTAQFTGTKTLDGQPAEKDAYSFQLLDSEGNIIETVKTTDGGFVQFRSIRYENAGTYTYTIKEVNPKDDKIDYDKHVETVTVKVTETDGKLKSEVTYDSDGIAFANTTRPGSLKINKIGKNVTDQNKDDEFTFKIILNNSKGHSFGDDIYWYTEDATNTSSLWDGVTSLASDVFASFSEPIVLTAYGADGDIASGVSGGCTWVIDADGVLTISPTNGTSGILRNIQYENRRPWNSNINDIKKIVIEEGVATNTYAAYLFSGLPNCTDMQLGNLDTSRTQDFTAMFYGCKNLRTVDVSNFNTSNATKMGGMFKNCDNVKSIDVSKWNVSKVTSIAGMFAYCSNLENLDVSKWNVGNIVDTFEFGFWDNDTHASANRSGVFEGCSKLKTIDVSAWNTSKMYTAENMFYGCSSVEKLDVSKWNTANMRNMRYMFNGCGSLTEIDLASWNTSRVTNMTGMFYDCKKLTSVDASSFKTPSVADMSNMFSGCSSAKSIDISSLDTSKVTKIYNMFYGCSSLERVELSNKYNFKGNNITPAVNQAILPTPPSTKNGIKYTGKWIREDRTYGPFTPAELRNNYVSSMHGTWVWEVDSSNGVVLFDATEGVITSGYQQAAVTNTNLSVKMPTREETVRPHYYLKNWNTKEDGTGSAFKPGETYTNVPVVMGGYVTLYAQWTGENVRDYTVNHYKQKESLDGYNDPETEKLTGEKGTEVTPDVRSYPGFRTPEKQTVTIADDDSTVVDYYYDRLAYTIEYDGNGATSGQMEDQKIPVNTMTLLKANAFRKTGSIFTGWSTSADGSGNSYTNLQQIRDLAGDGETVKLYAQWLGNSNEPISPEDGVIYVKCKPGETIVIPELPDGTTYTIEEIDLPDGWTLTSSEGEEGTIEANETESATFTNEYSANGSVVLEAHKKLENGSLESGAFKFELLDSEKNVLQTTVNDAVDTDKTVTDENGSTTANDWAGTAPAVFEEITYTLADVGTHTYYIREVKDNDSLLEYDDHLETVTVTVTDTGDGQLTAEAVYDKSGALFTNKVKDTELKISKKVLNPEYAPAGEKFTFSLELTDSENQTLDGTYNAVRHGAGDTEEELTVTSGGTFTLADGEYIIISGLPNGTQYVVTEAEKEDWELTESKNTSGKTTADEMIEVPFSNTYIPPEKEKSDVDAQLMAYKHLDGRAISEDDNFTFELQDEQGNTLQSKPCDKTGGADSTVTFDKIGYTSDDAGKVFTYYIREVEGDDESMTYDKTLYTVRVTPTLDEATNTMSVDTVYLKSEKNDAGDYEETEAERALFSNKIEYVNLSVSKKWDDDNDRDRIRPANVTVNLLQNGRKIDSAELSQANDWSARFKDLPKNSGGKEITYSITEDAIGNYNPEIPTELTKNSDGTYSIEVTNSYTPQKTSLSVNKEWNDDNDRDRLRPVRIEVELLANGNETGKKLTLSESNNWAGTWTELPMNEAGQKIEYSVKEISKVDGYEDPEMEGDATKGFTIRNTHEIRKTSVTAAKRWRDRNGSVGSRPASVEVELYANDKPTGDVHILTEANDWSYTWNDLPYNEAGEAIEYKVREVGNYPGYETSYSGTAEEGLVVTNTYDAKGSISLTGIKKMAGRELTAEDKYRFVLKENGVVVAEGSNDTAGIIRFDSIEYTLADVGTHTYVASELPSDTSGVRTSDATIAVDVTVEDNKDGTLKVTSSKTAEELTFVNTYGAKGSIRFTGTKKMKGRELTAKDIFTFNVYEDGKLVTTGTNDKSGLITFGAISYTYEDIGRHVYKISEADTAIKGVRTDKTVYTAIVNVEDAGDGTLKVTKEADFPKLIFTNNSKSVKTGDDSHALLYTVLFLASLLALAYAVHRRRKA